MNFLQLDRTVSLLISSKVTLINKDMMLSGRVKIFSNPLYSLHLSIPWGTSLRKEKAEE